MLNKYYNSSTLLPIITNTIPIIGVLFFGWSAFQVVFLYWCETVIILFLNVIDSIMADRHTAIGILDVIGAMVPVVFNGVFIMFQLAAMIAIFDLTWESAAIAINSTFYSVTVLFVIKTISFIHSYIKRDKFYNKEIIRNEDVMALVRVLIMMAAIIFGGFLATASNAPALVTIILILVKVYIEINIDLKEAQKTL